MMKFVERLNRIRKNSKLLVGRHGVFPVDHFHVLGGSHGAQSATFFSIGLGNTFKPRKPTQNPTHFRLRNQCSK
jgi:hypothetical protein